MGNWTQEADSQASLDTQVTEYHSWVVLPQFHLI